MGNTKKKKFLVDFTYNNGDPGSCTITAVDEASARERLEELLGEDCVIEIVATWKDYTSTMTRPATQRLFGHTIINS